MSGGASTRTVAVVAAFTLATLVCLGAVAFGVLGRRDADSPVPAAASQAPAATSPATSAVPSPTASSTRARHRPTASPSAPASHAPRHRERHRPASRPAVVRRVFPLSGCEVGYSAAHHDYPATDMFAPRGCLFVSPVAGTVDEVGRRDRWSSSTNAGADRGGLFVSVVGVDGVRYYGSHLESVLPSVVPGASVQPGTPLGHVGDTGSAAGTGTHLHFGLSWPTPPGYWWIRRGAVLPSTYLDAWRAGRDLSPRAAVDEARRAYGDDSRCHDYC